jgi:hypothetical protein
LYYQLRFEGESALDLYRIRDDEEFGAGYHIRDKVLQHVPNLCQLKIETCYVEMNGSSLFTKTKRISIENEISS